MADFAVPTLPMRDPKETRAFYEKLGFICAHEVEPPDSFLFMIRNGVQLQFFESPFLDGTLRDHTCYIYVDDLQKTYDDFKKGGCRQAVADRKEAVGRDGIRARRPE
jgi:catechol 2,3-dioxygenase-like lactoylglutathione lyase family enzyme